MKVSFLSAKELHLIKCLFSAYLIIKNVADSPISLKLVETYLRKSHIFNKKKKKPDTAV